MSRPPQLLRQGWSTDKARTRHLKYAHPLVEAGVTFRGMKHSERERTQQIVRAHVPGVEEFTLVKEGRHRGAVLAEDHDQQVIGVLALEAADIEGVPIAMINAVVTLPEHRGRGIGTVLLGVMDQLLIPQVGSAPELVAGNCAPEDARFYQRAGFTVLQPGEVLPFGRGVQVREESEYPCWFYRGAL